MKNRKAISKNNKGLAELRQQMAETDERLDKRFAETNRHIAAINRKLEKYGVIQGEIAEDLFSRNVESLLNNEGIEINEVIPNMKYDGVREYDIVAVNESEVCV